MRVHELPDGIEVAFARVAAVAAPVATLAARLYVGWVFLKSGWLKLSDWDSTMFLFESEYHVPVLSPKLAAIAGTGGELAFGALVMVGLYGRLSTLGLFAVNAMAVISYRHVLLAEGYEAAFAQHVLWAALLVALFVTGPGALSLDRLRGRTPAGTPAGSTQAA